MSNSQLNRSNLAGQKYVWDLVSAYRRFIHVIDPDYAIQNEPEAWIKVRRDADIAAAIQKRRQAVAGLDWGFVPPTDEDQDKFAAEFMTYLFQHIRRFHWSRYNMAEAEFRGSSYAYIEGRRMHRVMPGEKVPRLMWVPTGLPHVDRYRWRIVRVDDTDEPNIRTVCHAFEQTEDTLGYGRGLLQSIYFWWRAKEVLMSQGLAGVERWAQGFLTVGVDGLRPGSVDRNNDAIVDEWLEQVNKQRTDHAFVHDSRDKIQVHDWPATGAQQVNVLMNMIQGSLDRLILSSRLPTGGGDGNVGSLSRAVVEQSEMEATFESGRLALSETLDDSVGRLTWSRNHIIIREMLRERGLPMANRPKFSIFQRRLNNPEMNTRNAVALMAAGVPLKAQEIYEKTEWEQPAEDDDIIVGSPSQGSQPGFFPQGFGPSPDLSNLPEFSLSNRDFHRMKMADWLKLQKERPTNGA